MHNLPEFSVSEVSIALKRSVEAAFSRVRVRGEISGFKRAASGHLYFALKDEDSVLDGVCWRGSAGKLGLNPEDGMEVIVTGRLTTYPGRSKYQIVVDSMELAGVGALLKLLEDRRRKLLEEGLFDEDRKQDLPYIPDVIGVVTSPTGAVIRDILHRLEDRFPRRVLIWPVVVQGEGAAEQVTAAIQGFNDLDGTGDIPRPDLLIVARGGGSLEDLMPFNEENVVRAAAASDIPLISAVGHETDTTLIDFAADRRAPTPTAAAEMAVPVRLDLIAHVAEQGSRLTVGFGRLLEDKKFRVQSLCRGLPNLKRLTEEMAQRLDDWSERFTNSLKVGQDRRKARVAELSARLVSPKREIERARSQMLSEARALKTAGERIVKDRRNRFDQLSALLESYSFERVLDRGFVLVRDDDGQPVLSAKGLKTGDGLNLHFHDGDLGVAVTGKGGAPKPKKKKTKAKDDGQGTLL